MIREAGVIVLHNCASNNNNRLVIGLDRHCDSIFSSFLHGLFLSKRRLARSRVPRHVYEEEKRERKERKWKRIDGKIRTARRASRPASLTRAIIFTVMRLRNFGCRPLAPIGLLRIHDLGAALQFRVS